MGWLISRALMADFENSHCSREPAAESSGGTSSDGGQSVPSSETPMPQAYLSSGRTKEFSRLSRSGMTFAALTESLGEDVLTWCLAGSRAKTSPQPEEGQESTGSGLDSGVRWRESFRRFDPATSSWRTHRCLFDEALPASSVTLPRWGMTVGGVLWERLTPGLPTSGIEYGLWPTPNCDGYRSDGELRILAKSLQTREEYEAMSTRACVSKKERWWPTPCASEGLDCGTNWASLAAVDKGGRIARRMATRGGPETQQSPAAQLNPNWVEWLMGWPIGWTDLGPLATDKFRQWLRWHGRS